MADRKKRIGKKINRLLLVMVFTAVLIVGTISIYSLHSMKRISEDNGQKLGETVADDKEEDLKNVTVDNLQRLATEKAAAIEEKFIAIETYVLGIAAQAQDIYEHPEEYPDREVALPVPDSNVLAAQLLWSESLEEELAPELGELPSLTEEILKLGNVQDMLVQYTAGSDMVSSAYVATESGWMIQADYIAYSKYNVTNVSADLKHPLFYEAKDRQWYKRGGEIGAGQVVYTDVIRDVHGGGDCIVCASPIYRDDRLVAVAGVGSYLETVSDAVLGMDVGEYGYAFLVNEKGCVMVSGKADGETMAHADQSVDLRESDNTLLAQAAIGMVSGKSDAVELDLDGGKVYLAYAPLERLGWSLVTVVDGDWVLDQANESQEIVLSLTEDIGQEHARAIRNVYGAFVAALICITLFVCMCGTHFSDKLTKPIHSLADEVTRWDGSDFEYRVDLQTGDEIEDLGGAFNSMIAQIKEYVGNLASMTAEKERIRTEIQVANRLQADMLPAVEGIFADRDDFMLAALMTPAKGVGGDFYDFFLLDDEHLVLVIADVSGKGVPAALFMVVSRTMIRSRLMTVGEGEHALSGAVEDINRSLCDNNKDFMFVTAWIGILSIASGEVDFVNAGHCRPLIRRKDGSCEYDTTFCGMMLAGMEDTAYRQGKFKLGKGDLLLLYTDGVTEATSPEQDLYGEQRLLKTVEEAGNLSPKKLLNALWTAVDGFRVDEPQFDDITMLAISWRGHGFEEKSGIPTMQNMQEFMNFVETVLSDRGVPAKTAVKIQVTVDEVFSNICYYSGATEVTVGIRIDEKDGKKARQEITIYFEDDGIPFNPLDQSDPDISEMMGRRREGGLGIYLVKKRMDKVEYEYINDRNRLTVYKASEN